MKRLVGIARPRYAWTSAFLLVALGTAPTVALADEGGVGFWVPGFFGSLAAAPQQPGMSFAVTYYHPDVSAGGNVSRARAITIGAFNPTVDLNLNANLRARPDLVFFIPSYTFEQKVLGGQFGLAMAAPVGRSEAAINGSLTAAVGPLSVTRPFDLSDSVVGFGDLAPMATLRWNEGVHNWMAYVTADVPVGIYDSRQLANLGLGHWAMDGGGAYTYFNPQSGYEFSAAAGFTYNFINPSTQYQNGVDFHLDWSASRFVTKQWQLGIVGYVYDQVTGDSGSGDRVGSFESRVFGVGPQVGYLFPITDKYQGYVNVKGYGEFGAQNRPDGWNVWLTFAISPAAPTPPSSPTPRMITK